MKNSTKVLLIAAVMFTFATIAAADHAWGDRHWARQQNPFLLVLGENLPPEWDIHLNKASADWNNPPIADPPIPTVVLTDVRDGNGSSRCLPTKGRVEICDGAGHKTLGATRVWLSRTDHIEQAVITLSDYHLLSPLSKYNSPAWRQYVVCHEIGHTLGLDHRDENINNPNIGSCLDYNEDPDGTKAEPDQLANIQPDKHDFEQLRDIYAHLDSFDSWSQASSGSASARSNAKLENSSEWGKGIRQDARGRTNVFELDLGRGERVVTFVLWAD
jgi:hypothetical protein